MGFGFEAFGELGLVFDYLGLEPLVLGKVEGKVFGPWDFAFGKWYVVGVVGSDLVVEFEFQVPLIGLGLFGGVMVFVGSV